MLRGEGQVAPVVLQAQQTTQIPSWLLVKSQDSGDWSSKVVSRRSWLCRCSFLLRPGLVTSVSDVAGGPKDDQSEEIWVGGKGKREYRCGPFGPTLYSCFVMVLRCTIPAAETRLGLGTTAEK